MMNSVESLKLDYKR